jgi:hypothetical protein
MVWNVIRNSSVVLTFLCLCGGFIGPAHALPASDSGEKPTIIVEVVSRPVFYLQGKQSKEVQGLTIALPVGTTVYCGPRGLAAIYSLPDAVHLTAQKAYIRTKDKEKPLPGRREKDAFYYEIQSSGLTLSRRDPAYRPVKNLRLAGRPKGNVQVISPTEGARVWEETLVFAWKPLGAQENVTLEVADSPRAEAFWQVSVRGDSGQLSAPEELQQKLRDWRARNANKALYYRFNVGAPKDQANSTDDIAFWLLPDRRANTLKSELSTWDENAFGVMRHLGRAGCFEAAELFMEAALEYEAAWKLEPKSVVVRNFAAEAFLFVNAPWRAQRIKPDASDR